MGLTTLALVLGTIAVSGNDAKADAGNQTTTQITQAQSNIDNLQKDVNDAATIANDADQKVKASQQVVDKAQNEVTEAQNDVNKSNSVVVDVQNKLDEAKTAQNTAKGKLDNDKENIANKNDAVNQLIMNWKRLSKNIQNVRPMLIVLILVFHGLKMMLINKRTSKTKFRKRSMMYKVRSTI